MKVLAMSAISAGIGMVCAGMLLYRTTLAQRVNLEKETRRLLEKSPGDGADYIVNEGFGRYWAISEHERSIILRYSEKIAHEKTRPVSEIAEQWPFVIKNWRNQYRVEQLYVALPETDPTRPLCPEGWEYVANTFSDNGDSTYQGLQTGRTYVRKSWNGLGSCVRAIPSDPSTGSYGGSESYGPVRLRTTACDYQEWLAKQTKSKTP